MNIITTLFKVKRIPGSMLIGDQTLCDSAARQQEYLDCLLHNLAHPGVASVILLVEGMEAYRYLCHHVLAGRPRLPATAPTLLDWSKGSVQAQCQCRNGKLIPILFPGSTDSRGVTLPARQPVCLPTYADLFRIANQLAIGTPCMVCNADIYLSPHHFSVSDVVNIFRREKTLNRFSEADSRQGKQKRLCLSLTRYESHDPRDAPLIFDYRGSHDAFVVLPPLQESFLRAVAHPQNAYQAENVVIHELQRCGYTVMNPCLDLRIIHRHASGIRQWLPSVDPTRYGRAAPTTMQKVAIQLAQST